MPQPKSVVGLDVHATQTHACVLSPETGELRAKRLNGPPRRSLDYLEGLQPPLLAVYEAGPTGYGLARGGAARGLDVRDPSRPTGRLRRPTGALSGACLELRRLAASWAHARELAAESAPGPAAAPDSTIAAISASE